MSKDTQFIAGILFVILGNTSGNSIISSAQYVIGVAFMILAIHRMGMR